MEGLALHSRNPTLETKQASSTDTLKTKFLAPYLGEQTPKMAVFKEHGHTLSKLLKADVTCPSIHKKAECQDRREKTLAASSLAEKGQHLSHHTQKRTAAQADSVREGPLPAL